MRPVCEVMVQHIFPALRASIARELMNEYNLNQSEIAKMLGVSQPAISQYLRQLRGGNNKLLEDKIVMNEIKNLCNRIYNKELDSIGLMNEFCNICKIITSKKIVCELHNGMYKLENCMVCAKGMCTK
ncbi:MAG: ArsR family transcriptional regulator [Candidatus Aenigmatarchaeota archaeon]